MLEAMAATFKTTPERLNYLVNVDDKLRIAYFETPKVACTSIKKYMQDVYAGKTVEHKSPSHVHDRNQSPLKTLLQLSCDELNEVFYGDYRRFSFVRNPFVRVLSGYIEKIVINPLERRRHLTKLGFAEDDEVSFKNFLRCIDPLPDIERDIHFASQSLIQKFLQT